MKSATIRKILLTVLAVLIPAFCSAQMPIKLRVAPQIRPDSIDSIRGTEKHFWRAAAETAGQNIALWAWDRYVQKGDFAKISFKTIAHNFRTGFKWDNDQLGTNTFLHPYNGSLYFNAGRSNGFNFWQSELFAIGGSAMWELFMENEPPSTNDIIATPIGGAAMGEVLFRASDAVLDDSSTGIERVSREVAAFIISPMRGFNRLVTGESWRRRPTTGRLFGTPSVAIQGSIGLKLLACQGHYSNLAVGSSVMLDVEYGDRFEHRSGKPYDYFTFHTELNFLKRQPVLGRMSIKGRLLSREILERRRLFMSIGLYQHFDYYDSDTVRGLDRVPYKLGIPASVGFGVLLRDINRRGWVFDAYTHLNGIVLGSILSDHYKVDKRTYNWSSGFSVKAGFNLVFRKNIFALSVNHEFYRLFTWSGYHVGEDLTNVDERTLNVMGDKSQSSFNVTDVRLIWRLHKRLYVSFIFDNYVRRTHYRDFPDVTSATQAFRIMFSYKL